MIMLLSKCRSFIIFLTFSYIFDSVFASNIDEILKNHGFTGDREHDLELCKTKIDSEQEIWIVSASCTEEYKQVSTIHSGLNVSIFTRTTDLHSNKYEKQNINGSLSDFSNVIYERVHGYYMFLNNNTNFDNYLNAYKIFYDKKNNL